MGFNEWVVEPVKRNVVTPFMQVLRGGIAPAVLTLSVAVGVAGGIFPIPGITTAIALGLALPFGNNVNKVIVTVANLLCTIPDVLLMPAFIAIGSWVLGSPSTVAVDTILVKLREDLLGALSAFSTTLLRGVLGWVVVLPLIIAVVYISFLPLAKLLVQNMANVGHER